MKVKDLIKILSDYNPNAIVKFYDKGITEDIDFYSFECGDSSNLKNELNANEIMFCYINTIKNEYINNELKK